MFIFVASEISRTDLIRFEIGRNDDHSCNESQLFLCTFFSPIQYLFTLFKSFLVLSLSSLFYYHTHTHTRTADIKAGSDLIVTRVNQEKVTLDIVGTVSAVRSAKFMLTTQVSERKRISRTRKYYAVL